MVMVNTISIIISVISLTTFRSHLASGGMPRLGGRFAFFTGGVTAAAGDAGRSGGKTGLTSEARNRALVASTSWRLTSVSPSPAHLRRTYYNGKYFGEL
jgi:hypothetical protein